MESTVVVNQVIILFLVMLAGFYARKRNIITANMTGKLSNLLLQVTQPMLVVSSFNFEISNEMLRNAILVLVIAFLIHLFSMVLGKFIYRGCPEEIRKVLKFITVFSNCGFMGFPVLESIFGSKGVFYGALYVIPFNVLALSYGVLVFTGKSDKDTIKKILTHPVILSVGVGMVLFLLQIKLPDPISRAITMLGSMTSPLSMLIVGSLLAAIPFREMFGGKAVYIGSAVRLIILPLIIYGLLLLLQLPKDVFRVCVILSAMPAAANTAIFAERFGGDAMLSSRLVSISTIFSIFTIPLILMLL
jgi:predicted permease